MVHLVCQERKVVYEGIFQSPKQTHSFITNYLLDLNSLPKPGPVRSIVAPGPATRAPLVRSWVPPPKGIVKLNVVGVVNSLGQKGVVAAVCRDRDGMYLGSSVLVFANSTNPSTLEVYAAREALALAADLNLQRIHIASECDRVIKDIRDGSGGEQGAIIKEIIITRNTFDFCSFNYERSLFNFEAHTLAKFGCNLRPFRHIWLGSTHDQNLVPINIEMNQ